MTMTAISEAALRRTFVEPAAAKEITDALNKAEASAEAIGSALKVAGGITQFAAAASVTIATGLTGVEGFSCVQEISTAPTPIVLTAVVDNGNVTVYAWKATAVDDNTMIAASGSWSIRWVAVGQ